MGLLDILGGGGDKGFAAAREAMERNRELYDKIAMPEYAQYTPELYDDLESANYELTSEDPQVKSMQLEALARMQGLSEEGLSGVDDAAFYKARAMGDQMAKSKTDAAIQDAQARGVSGGGQEFALREQAAQAGAQRAQEAALERASAAAQQRAQYLNSYANQASGARDQNYRTQAANTDVINRFNQANTQQRNVANVANTDSKNEAWKYNEGLKDKNYNNQLGKADRISGFNNRAAEIASAEDEANRRRRQAQIGAIGAIGGGIAGSMMAPVGGGAAGASAGASMGSQFGALF